MSAARTLRRWRASCGPAGCRCFAAPAAGLLPAWQRALQLSSAAPCRPRLPCPPGGRRNIVLGKWDTDTTRFLTEEECLGGWQRWLVPHLLLLPLAPSAVTLAPSAAVGPICRRCRRCCISRPARPTARHRPALPPLPQPGRRRAGRHLCRTPMPSCSARAPSTSVSCMATRACRCRRKWRRP